jgi:hypothetical protein
MSKASINLNKNINYEQYKKIVIEDYKTVVLSRECSVIGRREVFLGKGKFGIFGDGKELPQMALNHFFNDGDFRSGYYRDQTLLMAQKLLTPENFFAALYAHTDLNFEPMSGGRQMGGHFLSKSVNQDGSWVNLMKQKNHSSDISPTASQMPRLVGLAQASKFYRKLKVKILRISLIMEMKLLGEQLEMLAQVKVCFLSLSMLQVFYKYRWSLVYGMMIMEFLYQMNFRQQNHLFLRLCQVLKRLQRKKALR